MLKLDNYFFNYTGAENYFGILSAVIAKPIIKEENKD
jgi:hypothetical protein